MPETTPDTFPALFWAYTAIWFILCAYMWSLGLRVRKLEKSTKFESDNK